MGWQRVDAPWTVAQVEFLNQVQRDDGLFRMHPFTCGPCRDRLGTTDHTGEHDDRILVATLNGWICPTCDYTQSSAMILDPLPTTPRRRGFDG